ncbi:MAG: TIGR02444 family protein [Luminiphilus sp.]|nr:TIGR02444 family protein [Luminiphilus sp.]
MPDVEVFWAWALQRWSKPDVAEALLRLQDEQGSVVLELLLLVWLDQNHMLLSAVGYQKLREAAEPWNRDIVRPLRSMRTAWRGRQDLHSQRQRLKGLELMAERSLAELYMEVLQALGPEDLSVGAASDPSSNLMLAVAAASPALDLHQAEAVVELLTR